MTVGSDIYDFTPLSHLRPGMTVLVEGEQGWEEAVVDDVVFDLYDGPVYDLEVADTYTYGANGFLAKNSIYRFRGADMRNIVEFETPSPTSPSCCSSRTTGRARPSSTRPTRSSPTTSGASPRSSGRGRPGRGDRALPRRRRGRRGPVDRPPDHAPQGLRPCLGRLRDLLPHQRPEPRHRGVPHPRGHPVQGRGRHPLLRPARGQGRAGLPEGHGEPGRRGQREAGDQHPQARRRRLVDRPPRRLRPQPRAHLRRRPARGSGRRGDRPGGQGHRGLPEAARRPPALHRRRAGRRDRSRHAALGLRLRAAGRALHRGRGPHREPGRAGRCGP